MWKTHGETEDLQLVGFPHHIAVLQEGTLFVGNFWLFWTIKQIQEAQAASLRFRTKFQCICVWFLTLLVSAATWWGYLPGFLHPDYIGALGNELPDHRFFFGLSHSFAYAFVLQLCMAVAYRLWWSCCWSKNCVLWASPPTCNDWIPTSAAWVCLQQLPPHLLSASKKETLHASKWAFWRHGNYRKRSSDGLPSRTLAWAYSFFTPPDGEKLTYSKTGRFPKVGVPQIIQVIRAV